MNNENDVVYKTLNELREEISLDRLNSATADRPRNVESVNPALFWAGEIRQQKWDRRYLELAKHVSTWSKDPSTQVGAVVVNYEYQLEFLGYNGFPKGVDDSPERYADRELKYKMVVHSEQNAIRKAGIMARGASLYVYPSFAIPNICHDCAKQAIQAGIKEVIGYEPDQNDARAARWEESIKVSKQMFQEAGVTWRVIKI